MDEAEENILHTSATAELYHTNLLRVQAKELLSESILHLSSHTGELSEEVKWANQVQSYLDTVKLMITDMGQSVLSPDTVRLSTKHEDVDGQQDRFWIQLQSDLSYKHIQSKEKSMDRWEFLFPGGSSLEIQPVFSYAAHGAGLTTKASNAHVIPTIDLAVLIPVRLGEDGQDTKGYIYESDYMNGRYFDVGFSFYFRPDFLF